MAASKYHVEISSSAEKFFRKLPQKDLIRITSAILALRDDPYPVGCVKLSGEENCYRIRIGNYRIVYEMLAKKLLILILKIGHRKDVYRH